MKQKRVLSIITDLTHKKGIPPSMEELRGALDLSSISSVQRHTDALKEKGYLENIRGLSFPESTEKVRIPLVGNVACGFPLLATENIEAYISYNASQIRGSSDNYFFLRAVGDSMNNTNISGKSIDDGDFVLVRKQQAAEPGSQVVALIGDDATIKKFIPEDGHVRLQPESTNPRNKPIILFEDFSIQGVVEDVIKKGGR
ncbi:MAG TPA: transcriptional repressor LexA [Patescibacteria group bacterium]|nr:transcriptional repressor LexA [Patescibacteria group bacterium]